MVLDRDLLILQRWSQVATSLLLSAADLVQKLGIPTKLLITQNPLEGDYSTLVHTFQHLPCQLLMGEKGDVFWYPTALPVSGILSNICHTVIRCQFFLLIELQGRGILCTSTMGVVNDKEGFGT